VMSVTNNDISGGFAGNWILHNNVASSVSATLTGNDFGSVGTTGGGDSVKFNGVANTASGWMSPSSTTLRTPRRASCSIG
jgi:hypothetical protein